jgi:hypothetical protein
LEHFTHSAHRLRACNHCSAAFRLTGRRFRRMAGSTGRLVNETCKPLAPYVAPSHAALPIPPILKEAYIFVAMQFGNDIIGTMTDQASQGTRPRGAEHYTDTAGATDHVFGLCRLLGYRFAPRIKDLKDRKALHGRETHQLAAACAVDRRHH